MKKSGILLILVFVLFSTLLLGNEYGNMYDISTTSATIGTAWAKVGDYEGSTVSSANIVYTAADDRLTVNSAGTYLIRYSVSFTGSAITWQTAVAVGDGTAATNTKYGIMDRHIGDAADVGNASGTALVSISSGEYVYLVAIANAASSSFTIEYAQLTIVKAEQLSSPYYADIAMVDQTTNLSDASTYYQIQGFNTTNADFTESTSDGWNLDGAYIKAYGSDVGGTYLAIASVSFSGQDDGEYYFALSKDASTPLAGTQFGRVINFKGTLDIGNAVSCGIITIVEDDQISLIAEVTNAETGNMKVERGNLTLIKLNGTSSSAPYAGMYLTNNTASSTSISSAGWSKVSYFGGSTQLSDWQYQNTQTLHPINLTAGKYLMNYCATTTLEGTESANVQFTSLFTLLVNGSEKADITMERFLDKKTIGNYDYGSVSGSSIISIEGVSDDVEFAIKTNDATSYDLEIKECNIAIVRIWTKGDGTLPVTLSSFTAQYIENTPTLCWTTQSETSNAGWNIYRGDTNEALSNEEAYLLNLSLGLIPGAGSTSEPTDYSFEDVFPVYAGNTYFYWLESVDYSGESEIYGPISLTIPEDEWQNPNSPEIPKPYGLHQNYPNPFNPSTEISFMMKENCIAELSIYNIKGQKIKILFTNESIPRDELIIS
ncbi:MAG: hypothetical protein HQ534_09315, partial [Armatimonadetes bacterium]|nr:hypothetical protein [Armatimonadota bacterium]